jgi:NAD(P)-dependent dehydrogenase (short-subunit alcohol dehydrogenase family)
MLLANKRALVTGASRGIGAAIAKVLAAEGADVAITYEKSADRAAEVVAEIERLGRRAVAIQANSAEVVEVQASVQKAAAFLGGLDILVNNVGIFLYAPVKDVALKDVDAILNVNVRAPVIASQAAIPHLGRGGRIINIGSWFGEQVQWPNLSVYAMSKSALVSFTKGLARELGMDGITVNLVQPGAIDSDMNPSTGPLADTIRQPIAVGKYGSGEDIAHAVAFLASEKAQYITGTALTVDGGMLA